MPDDSNDRGHRSAFSREVGAGEQRRLKAERARGFTALSGFGMMGIIGWSVALPTLLGALAGLWLDSHFPGRHSWTLALLVVGLAGGCVSAWRWVTRQGRAIGEDEGEGPKL